MKRSERKELDKFVKEKLDIANDFSRLNYTPPDRTEKNRKLGERFATYFSNMKSNKRKLGKK